MRHLLSIFGLFVILSTPAVAVTEDWKDLQDRCATAVLSGERLNVAGLQDRLPDFLFDVVESDILGPRVELNFSGPTGRTVPTGVWGTQKGPFELWLIEYPTRAGFRAICEVRQARGATLSSKDVAALKAAFETADGDAIEVSRAGLTAYWLTKANPRGCPVVTRLSTQVGLRSAVSEAAGVPTCGGPSLASGVITPHGVLPSEAGR